MEETEIQNNESNINFMRMLVEIMMPKLPYHNFQHALNVHDVVSMYTDLHELNPHDTYLLRTAGLGHDLIYIPGRTDNEENTARELVEILPLIGYNIRDAIDIARMILSTKMPQNPTNLLEEILCDSDLDSLGRDDFFIWGHKYRKELGLEENVDWYKRQLAFLESHEYHTQIARDLRKKGKERNIERLREKIESYEEREVLVGV